MQHPYTRLRERQSTYVIVTLKTIAATHINKKFLALPHPCEIDEGLREPYRKEQNPNYAF